MTRKAQARPLLDAAAFCFLNATAGENDKGREWACLPFSSAQPTALFKQKKSKPRLLFIMPLFFNAYDFGADVAMCESIRRQAIKFFMRNFIVCHRYKTHRHPARFKA